MRYTRIRTDTFEKIQLNAGVIATAFTPDTGALLETDIAGATSGGITFHDSITYRDFGDDIDNCPKNTMELKKTDSREVTFAGTFATVDETLATMLVGPADNTSGHIVPRNDLKTSDFRDLWFIGDYSDKNGPTKGGSIAVKLLNALNTSGFQWVSSDREKGKFAFTFTGHYSIANPDIVPYEVYVTEGADEN